MTYIFQKVVSSPYMLMFDKLFQDEIHYYIRTINNPTSFRPYSPLDDVDNSDKRCENYLKLLFITITMRSLFLCSSVYKDYKYRSFFLLNLNAVIVFWRKLISEGTKMVC